MYMKKIIIAVSLFILLNFILVSNVLSWDNDVTHKDLSSFAAENSILNKNNGDYLKNLGFSKELLEEFKWNQDRKTVKDWLRDGAFYEDAGNWVNAIMATARWKNHFHNPLKPWSEAGLTDIQSGESSLLWAQDGSNQQGFLEKDWSWRKVRVSKCASEV